MRGYLDAQMSNSCLRGSVTNPDLHYESITSQTSSGKLVFLLNNMQKKSANGKIGVEQNIITAFV